jgi:hypothetical protein
MNVRAKHLNRHRLRHGKLVEPESIKYAFDRILYLRREADSILAQLRDKSLADDRVRHPTPEDYQRWRKAAGEAKIMFRAEERLTVEWLRAKVFDKVFVAFAGVMRDLDDATVEERQALDLGTRFVNAVAREAVREVETEPAVG